MRRLASVFAVLLALWTVFTSPALAQIAVVGSSVVEHQAARGETYSGTVVIRNLTGQHQPVRLYQTDYSFDADGHSRFDSAGTTTRSNARWITLARRSLTLAPRSEVAVSYQVAVPASDALTGSYWSTIMVEAAPNSARPSTSDSPSPQLGVGTLVRYATQVATHLGERTTRQLTFSEAKVVAETDTALFIDVQNTGERAYRPALWIEVYDEQGTLSAKARQQRGLLYPGTSLRQKFALSGMKSGAYRVVVFADAGADAVFAAPFSVRF